MKNSKNAVSRNKKMDLTFERVISLGQKCLSKKQINEYFNPGCNPLKSKTGTGDIFDWTIINDYKLLSECIENEFKDFFEKEYLELKNYQAGDVLNTKYNINIGHLFESNYYNFSALPQNLDLNKVYEIINAKINYLIEKFKKSKTETTLYVISHWMDKDYPTNPITKEDLIILKESLIKFRGNNNFTILYVCNKKEFDNFDNIIVEEAINLEPNFLGADNNRWKEIFDKFKYCATSFVRKKC